MWQKNLGSQFELLMEIAYMPAPPKNCPVLEQAEATRDAAAELRNAVSDLRVSLATCEDCALGGRCDVLKTFNAEINQAISEITEEWNLTL